MTRNLDVLERLAPFSGAPSRDLEDLLRLRAKRQLARKIGAMAVVAAIVAALLVVGIVTRGDRSKVPADPSPESNLGTFAGMVIRYTGDPYDPVGDLVAQDPTSGQVRTVFDLRSVPGDHVIYNAAISGDGRWAAFDAHTDCRGGGAALWVTNGVDEPRALTTPCADGSEESTEWAWSPIGSTLATVEGHHLILIDPATGGRTDLGKLSGDAGPLAWSPDGTRIAYGSVPTGSPNGNSPDGSVYVVSVDNSEHALIAESIGQVPGGEEGAGIAWSPDGTRLAVLADPTPNHGFPKGTLYVMDPDGSRPQQLAGGLLIAHTLGSPNIAWSPDGTRIGYATFSGAHEQQQIWSASADGSTPVLIFDPTADKDFHMAGGPVWSPDGTQIAFRYDTDPDQRSYLIANADGTGDVHGIDELTYRGWRGGWYFCECYG